MRNDKRLRPLSFSAFTGMAKGRPGSGRDPPSPTGGSPGREAKDAADGSKDKDGKASPSKSPSKRRTSFGGTSKREMRLELLGEDTPGPGAYLPASTFAKAASSSSMHRGKQLPTTTSSFRSTSAQRQRPRNEKNPGPGSFSPNMSATERNATNSAPHLSAKGRRFSALGSSEWDHAKDGGYSEPGPGHYEFEYEYATKNTTTRTARAHTHEGKHNLLATAVPTKYRTMMMDGLHAVNMGSRKKASFGLASPQHFLPHEQQIAGLGDTPGPSHYNVKPGSEITKADGHRSVFRPPTERKKGHDMQRSLLPDKSRKSRKNRSAAGKSPATVHV